MKKPLVFLFIATIGLSCGDFVSVDAPKTQLTSVTVFDDDATATAALMNIYFQISSEGFSAGGFQSVGYLLGTYSDELVSFSSGTSYQQFFNNSIDASNSNVSGLWGGAYRIIYLTNALIEGVSSSGNMSSSKKEQLLGEALFLRGFCYFYLVSLFGDVPLVNSTDYNVNNFSPRVPASQIFTAIRSDFLMAKDLLVESYPTGAKVRINKWSVVALLSRMYLFEENWSAAEEESTELLSSGMYSLTDLGDVFLKNSSEAIWQVMPPFDRKYTSEGDIFILTGNPTRSVLSDHVYNEFELGDKRRELWVGSITISPDTWYFPFKYKERSSNATGGEYSTILRLAEQYLIRSEARAKQGKIAAAISDLDSIRFRAGLPLIEDTNPSISSNDLLLAIERERRMELFSEWGHRWFDLKRTGRVSVVLESLKPGWNETDVLLPIPESEILINYNLRQNLGYN